MSRKSITTRLFTRVHCCSLFLLQARVSLMQSSSYASLHSFSSLVTRFTMSSDGAAAGSGGVVPPSVGDEPTPSGDTTVEEDAPVAPIPPLAAVCHRHPPWRQEPYELLKPMGEEVWLAERTCTSCGLARFRDGKEFLTSRS